MGFHCLSALPSEKRHLHVCVCVGVGLYSSHACVSVCAVLDPWVTAATAVLSRLESWVGFGRITTLDF